METPSLPPHRTAKKSKGRDLGSVGLAFFYLLMKVVVESNQVEIAFEALQSPLEEILFGAAPLKAKAGGIRGAHGRLVLQPRAALGGWGKSPTHACLQLA